MPEMTQDQLDGMSVEQLEAHVAQEGALEAPQQTENGQAEATSQAAEATQGENQTTETPKADEPPAWFKQYAENTKRELGSLRSLQSLADKLPKMVEQQLEKRLSALQQAQQNANLSPEDREAQAQLQTQQQQLARFVREQARAEFGEVGKDYIALLDQLKEQQQDQGHKNNALELVKEAIPENADKAWNDVFQKSYEDIVAGKPGAIERQERLEKDPAFVALAMIQAQRSKVQTQATQVTQNRATQAKAAAQGLTVTGSAKAAAKPVAEMSQAELDKMDIAELEAAIPEQSR
jgi:hypothetical protein